MQKERRSKKKAELNSPFPLPPAKPNPQKMKTIIPEPEKEEEEGPLKRRPRGTSWLMSSTTPSLAEIANQPSFHGPDERGAAEVIAQDPLITATPQTTPPLADEAQDDNQPMPQLREPAVAKDA